jgi:hypothetical protein
MSDVGGQRLSRLQRRAGQPRLIRLALSGSLNNTLLTSISALFLLGLGAAPLHIGILSAFSHLQKASRLVGLRFMPHLGKAGLMFWGRIAALPFLLALAFLALQGNVGPTAVWTTLLFIGLKGMLYHGGNTAWWPLVQDNTQDERLGGFLARMRLRQRLLEVLLPLGVGWYLGAQPQPERFFLPFALACIALVAGAIWVRHVDELPQVRHQTGIWRRLQDASGLMPLRRYCAFIAGRSLVQALTFPFWVVVLIQRGLPFSHVAALTSAMALGNMSGLIFWGRLVDRHGPRPVMALGLLGQALLGLAWLTAPQDAGLIWWAGVLYWSWGLLEGGLQLASSQAMVGAVEQRYQGEGFALAIYASAVGGSLGGISGGALFQWLSSRGLVWGWEPELLYLSTAPLLLAGVWLLSRRLADDRAATTDQTDFKP